MQQQALPFWRTCSAQLCPVAKCAKAALLAQASPRDADCNVPGALRLRGPLAEAALTGALALVLQRHDALRTRIVASPASGAPMQVCRRRPTFNADTLRVCGSA